MAVGWFIFPYVRDPTSTMPRRYCAVYDHTNLAATRTMPNGRQKAAIREIEILGDRALCKVRGLPGNLQTLAGFALARLPNVTPAQMDEPLNTFLNPQRRNRIQSAMLDAGYPQVEIDQRWANFNLATFRQCLRFMCRRRLKPRYDPATDTIFVDGDIVPAAGDPDIVDSEIADI